MQVQLESLRIQVVTPEGAGASSADAAALKKHQQQEQHEYEDEHDGVRSLPTSPIAFPMLPIDRYGFLITDKCEPTCVLVVCECRHD